MEEKKALLESALYLAEEPIDKEQIADILSLGSMGYVDMLIEEYGDELDDESRGLELVETPQGYELKVKNKNIDKVEHLAPHQDLSSAEVRTLSLIAYNTPVEQTDIVDIRGNRAYQHVKELVERGFIDKEKEGRTAILNTTDHFLDYFGLESTEQFKQQYDNEDAGREGNQQGVDMFS